MTIPNSSSSTLADNQGIMERRLERRRHPDYYFEDGSVVFLVEDTLFSVHKYLFRESPIFHGMFTHVSPLNGTEQNPISLADVNLAEFSCLCQYIYRRQLDLENKFNPSFEECTALFNLAFRFKLVSIALAALKGIKCTEGRTVEKLLIAKKANQNEWLLTLYETLCLQPSFISEAEGELLGVREVILLSKAREEYSRSTTSSKPESKYEILEKYFPVKRPWRFKLVNSSMICTRSFLTVCETMMDGLKDGIPWVIPSLFSPTRHPRYYFEDGSTILLVENVLFRVHKYLFERFLFFKDMFTLPQGANIPEGLSDDYPIRLSYVKADEFTCLCRFLYRGIFQQRFSGSFEQWKAIFRLSAMFLFDDLNSTAKTELEKIDGHELEKIVIARQHDIRDWLPPLYARICQRREFLSDEEGEILGLSTVMKLARIREKRLKGRSYGVITAQDIIKEMSLV